MSYALVAKINGDYAPIGVYKAKYDCIELGLKCMSGMAPTWCSKFNLISSFEIWTSEVLSIDLNTAKDYYTMGYGDFNSSIRRNNKDFKIKAKSLEYMCYEAGNRHARNSKYYPRLF